MRLNKTIKRIVALGTGLTTLGATFLGAMAAADLSTYPEPFVKDGVFDGFLVLGDNAAAKDVIGAVEIATALQAASVTTTTVSTGAASGTVTLTGSSFKVAESSDSLQLYENLTDVTTVVEDTDWDLLADGEISNEKGNFKYEQLLYLPNAKVTFDVDSDATDEDPHLYLYFPASNGNGAVNRDGTELYAYRLSFPTALKSDVDSSDDLDDIENEKLTILGKEYTIVTTDNSTADLVLMGGALEVSMNEGEEKTFTLGSGEDAKTYRVKVDAITDTANDIRALLTINGESTSKLNEGETKKLSDGTEIGIREIINVDATEGTVVDSVTFFLGAQKVEFKDGSSKYATATSSTIGTLEVGGTKIDEVLVDIKGTVADGTTSIQFIDIAWENTEDYYVPVGGKLSDRIEAEESADDRDKLLFQAFDFEFHGLDAANREDIKIKSKSTTRYEVSLDNTGGYNTDIPFGFLNSTGDNAGNVIKPGKQESKLLYLTNAVDTNVTKNNYFLVTDDETSRNSHLLRMGSVDSTNKQVTIHNEGSGASDIDDISYDSTTGVAEFVLNGKSYATRVSGAGLNISGIDDFAANIFYSKYGAKLWFVDNSAAFNGTDSTTTVTLEENPKDARDDAGTKYNISFAVAATQTATEMGAITITSTDAVWADMKSLDSVDNRQQGYTSYGTFIDFDSEGDQDKVTLEYGKDEAVANVFLTSGATAVSSTGATEGGTLTTETINKISVGAPKLASEVGDITAVNAIVIGGPCANAASAALTGVGAAVPECLGGLSLEAGNAILKLYEDAVTGKVALLVAGATADDTRRASRVLADYGQYALSGTEASVTGTSMTDISVGAVAAATTTDTTDGSAAGDGTTGDGTGDGTGTA